MQKRYMPEGASKTRRSSAWGVSPPPQSSPIKGEENSPHPHPTNQRQRTGQRGEAVARAFLERRGYQVIATNYRSPWGEVDIVARDGPTLAFVEVKARRSTSFGSAVEAVTARKAQRLVATAQHYLAERGLDVPWRVDLVAIDPSPRPGRARVTLVRSAVSEIP